MSKLCWKSVNMSSEDQNMDDIIRNWDLPKVPVNDIYKRKGLFESSSSYQIQTIEKTVPIQSEYTDLKLLERNAIRQHKRNYTYLHPGLIQVAVKPLTLNGLRNSVLVCLRDCRLLKFSDSLLAVAESSLCNGPIFFNCYPGYQVLLEDPHTLDVLTLNVQIPGFCANPRSEDIAIVYRVCYRVLNKFDPETKVPPEHYQTTFIETNLLNDNVAVRRTISWDEVEVPERWRS